MSVQTRKNKVLIANGQGFWGDSILGPIRLVREGPLDYLTLDYLADVTMSIMQKLRARYPRAGYATDFVTLLERTRASSSGTLRALVESSPSLNSTRILRPEDSATRDT